MRIRLAMATVAIMLLTFASFAEAQPGGRGPGGPGGRGPGGPVGPGGFGSFGGGLTRLALCNLPPVQKELELTAEQIKKIQTLMAESRPQFNRPGGEGGGERGEGGRRERGPRGERTAPPSNEGASQFQSGQYFVQVEEPPRRPEFTEEQREAFRQRMEDFRKQAEERAKETDTKLNEILLPHQVERLGEIRIQLMGTAALNDAEIAKELKITDKQTEEMAKVRQEASEAMQSEIRALFESGNREQIQAKIAELRKEIDEKVVGCLTKDQQSQFEKMKGKPFEMPQGGFGPGGGRGPRPGSEGGTGPQRPDA